VNDVRNVVARADIAAIPTLGGEGVPRAMLEAAALRAPHRRLGRSPAQSFVRQGVEVRSFRRRCAGLAEALERLAVDAELRRRQGEAARQRLLDGYTTEAVGRAIREAYRTMFRR
jgi:glycosyltransferase involved in cell wall biosynthesis